MPDRHHVSTPAVWTNGKLELINPRAYQQGLKKMQLADREAVVVRIEREQDAKTYGQMKYWHGYVLAPLVDYTGDHDWRLYLKAMFLPEGKHSLTELTYDEMRAFTEQCEAWAREHCPEAYEQHGREYVA